MKNIIDIITARSRENYAVAYEGIRRTDDTPALFAPTVIMLKGTRRIDRRATFSRRLGGASFAKFPSLMMQRAVRNYGEENPAITPRRVECKGDTLTAE